MALPPGVEGAVNRVEGAGDDREDKEMLLLPLPPEPLPLPRPDDFEPFGVDGACRPPEDEEEEAGGGGVPALAAFASSAAFWLFLPNGERAAADGRLGAGDGMMALMGEPDCDGRRMHGPWPEASLDVGPEVEQRHQILGRNSEDGPKIKLLRLFVLHLAYLRPAFRRRVESQPAHPVESFRITWR